MESMGKDGSTREKRPVARNDNNNNNNNNYSMGQSPS